MITVTGVFQPVDGQPARAVETVTLAIYADQVGGAPLWQETQNVAVDTKGRYALLLGATSPEGIPAAVLAAGAQWLGTKFDRPGEVESPRGQLTSVPYTLRAADADTLGGRPASAYLLAPTAGAAESSAMKPASESRAATSTSTTPNAVLPGTDGFVAKYVGTADVGPSAIYEAAGTGNVGIGTTNPLDALHVRFTNPGGTATGYAVQNLSGAANAYSGMLFYDQNGVLGQFQGFNNTTHEYRINNIAKNVSSQYNGSINFMTGGTSRFLVTTPGNIGIGTTAPRRDSRREQCARANQRCRQHRCDHVQQQLQSVRKSSGAKLAAHRRHRLMCSTAKRSRSSGAKVTATRDSRPSPRAWRWPRTRTGPIARRARW